MTTNKLFEGERLTLTLSGRLDTNSSPALEAELKRACTSVSVVDAEMDLKEEVKVFADNAVGVR